MDPIDLKDVSDANRITVELAAERTRMAFQRTRMGADRTLMAIMRTAMAMVAFGFAAYQGFAYLGQGSPAVPVSAAHKFGLVLCGLGALLQALGVWLHVQFMLELRQERRTLLKHHIELSADSFPHSVTLLISLALLAIAIFALLAVAFKEGPFT